MRLFHSREGPRIPFSLPGLAGVRREKGRFAGKRLVVCMMAMRQCCARKDSGCSNQILEKIAKTLDETATPLYNDTGSAILPYYRLILSATASPLWTPFHNAPISFDSAMKGMNHETKLVPSFALCYWCSNSKPVCTGRFHFCR
jgi:hypothetical protein